LADAAVGAGVFDDLEVLPWPGLFDAEEQGGLAHRDTTMLAAKFGKSRYKARKTRSRRGTTFFAQPEAKPQKTGLFAMPI
jgi:hypothetical protein